MSSKCARTTDLNHSHPHLKLMRSTAVPAFSVVMSTTCGEEHLATVRSVAARCRELSAEVIVALPRGVTYDALRDERNIRFVSVPDDALSSDVRRLAMAHATGDIVFVLDWSVLEGDEWCDRIRRYDASSRIGAGFENGRREDAAINWAEFLAARGVRPVDRGSALESFTATFASDARPRARSMLTKWTEYLNGVERVRPARQ
jgi:hypothetical protein